MQAIKSGPVMLEDPKKVLIGLLGRLRKHVLIWWRDPGSCVAVLYKFATEVLNTGTSSDLGQNARSGDWLSADAMGSIAVARHRNQPPA